MEDTGFDLQRELADILGEDEDETGADDPADEVLQRAKDSSKSTARKSETDYRATKLAAEAAKIQVRDTKAAASRAKVEDQLTAARERRAELVEATKAAADAAAGHGDTDPESLAASALSGRAEQLVAELDLEIADLEVAAPFAGVRDRDLGTYEVQRVKDDVSGAELMRARYTNADGLIGESAREVEDAEVRQAKVNADGYPDDSLRALDALREVEDARERLEAARTEISRRKLAVSRAERRAERANEIGLEAAARLDQQARIKIEGNHELSAEDRAIALARLEVPMSERKADKETWGRILGDAEDQAVTEQHENIVTKALVPGTHVYGSNDPLMMYLRDGARFKPEDLFGKEGLAARSVQERDPGVIAYLQGAGAIEGMPRTDPNRAVKIVDPGGELLAALEASRDASLALHERKQESASGGSKR